ncbi:MAG TPA: N-acetyltransferase [Desulfobacterales bacterium]|nr:N-acetyltransferase [Desulfobacterales bacterium]HIP40864.1 N-acetyltransferase [Desulfocapsa sulfexigens]
MSYSPCKFIEAEPADVKKAFHDLKRDMNPEFVHVFLDKLERYAAKPDRALFLAINKSKFVGFATIIDQSPPPKESDQKTIELLQNYACGTGLMVLPEFRHKGIATRFVKYWELWARQNSFAGIWVVTRQMADWYKNYHHYSILGTTLCHDVAKTVLARSFEQ